MPENQIDPLQKLFRSLPEIEPPPGLTYKILNSLEEGKDYKVRWLLKPALVLGLVAVVTLAGWVASLKIVQEKTQENQPSPVLRWTQGSDSGFIRSL